MLEKVDFWREKKNSEIKYVLEKCFIVQFEEHSLK